MLKLLRYLLIMLYVLIFFKTSAQTNYTYQQLREYEGTYEYHDKTTLQIAASPKEKVLYAMIGESKYKLTPSVKDVFLNTGKQEVRFLRNKGNISGYRVNDNDPEKVYKLITKKVTFSNQMWFARGNGDSYYRWQYHIPQNRHDGIETGSIVNSGLDTGLLRTMVNRTVDGTYKDVHSILLFKNGKLIMEEYFYGYDVNKLHELRSATKSFTSALVGIATDKHLIKSINTKIVPLFPEYKLSNMDDRKRAITIKDLLTQQSGFACNDHDDNSPGQEVKMYSTDDWVKFMLDLPMIDTPGHTGSYCSGNIALLNRIVEKASGTTVHDFARENLFSKLGVTNFTWDFVPDKSHQDSYSQVRLRPRDMGKFGLLYLNLGKWKGQQIISADWVKQSMSKHSVVDGIGYGYLWWGEDLTVNGITYPGFAAKGNGGQRIFIWPQQNMVAVITAGNYNAQSPANKMLMECVLGGLAK